MESFTLEQTSYLAEIFGLIAVVISLIYLGMQIKQNTQAIRSTAAYEATQSLSDWYIAIGNNRQSLDTWLGGIPGLDKLKGNDKFQFMILMQAAFLSFQNTFYLAYEQTLNEEIKYSLTSSISIVKDTQGFKDFWEQRRSTFMKEFREYVEKEVLVRDHSNAAKLYNQMAASNE